jgi:hypothetical protein
LHAEHRDPPTERPKGFALAFVVMMLFAISVAGATGYLVVSGEFTVAKYGKQGAEALAVARAGLQRFVAHQIGVVGDDVSYQLGPNAIATITTRYLSSWDPLTDLYYIRSEGRVNDPLSVKIPAVRVVGAYAVHHRRPLGHHAQVILTAEEIDIGKSDWIWARDENVPEDCPGGGAPEIPGAILIDDGSKGSGKVHGDITGNPTSVGYPTFQDIYDLVGLRWDVLTDPNFTVDFEGPDPPKWAEIPTDSFPVVRYDGSKFFTGEWSGQGVLIVTGTFSSNDYFQWKGIVLAGEVWPNGGGAYLEGHVDGLFVGGLNGKNPMPTGGIDWQIKSEYWSCYANAANESLSYLELLPGTMYEVN